MRIAAPTGLAGILLALFAVTPATAQSGGATYHFNEGSGTTALDSSGGGNDASIDGPTYVPGYSGTALFFTGSDTDRVLLPPSVFDEFGNTAYVEAWIRPDAFDPVDGSYIFRKDALYNDYWMWLSGAGAINCLVYDTVLGIGNNSQSQGGVVPIGEWTKVACWYDGSTMHTMINGLVVATSTNSITVTDWLLAYDRTEIGNSTRYNVAAGNNHHYGFTGAIDEVRIAQQPVVDDPVDLIAKLVADVIGLNLQQGISNSLDAKLDSALNALGDLNTNNDAAAVNSLQAFINAVQAQSGSHIPEADATSLIASAQAIIDLLIGSQAT